MKVINKQKSKTLKSNTLEGININFDKEWKHSVSGEELEKRVHKHINELYATREKK